MGGLHRPGLIRPTAAQLLHLNPGHLVRESRWLRELMEDQDARIAAGLPPIIAGAASFSDYAENKVLDHITGRAEYAKPTFYLALCTVAPTDASTGESITEANYTGYARLKVEAASWGAAAGGEIKNSAILTFAECTEGESKIVGWAGCDAATKGNVIVWGTCSETVISKTQTPATVAKEQLVVKLD